MNETPELSPTDQILRLLETVPADTPRYRALKEALDFKGSWVRMAHRLKTVEEGELWEKWGYKNLRSYCKLELQLTRGEIRKIREGFAWLESEAPELAQAATDPSRARDGYALPVPDIDTVDQLAKGYRDVREQKIPRRTYEELKQAALDGNRSSYQLRREFKEAIPEDKRETKPLDPKKHFKKALKALEQALQELAELEKTDANADHELTERALKLRDEVSMIVATKED